MQPAPVIDESLPAPGPVAVDGLQAPVDLVAMPSGSEPQQDEPLQVEPSRPGRPPPGADRLPTLTEVIEFGPDAVALPTAHELLSSAVAVPAVDEAALVQRVLAELGPRIDAMLEARLREALAPALARAADGLIRDARAELLPALGEIVGEAVSRALEVPPR
ncbi:conserved hypothetical protein [Rubrivivax sp. A210]|uniref:hypothetical protein n=1 Tax=Rubrivivax sp. A210 TaxID=2772301 RepID=UPI001918BB90|nr:hypothetical protein [Rubrivivax sp. A210]CAD5373750.1 conserved hypothetical protein [Rubrivivax sp. A210]